MEEFRSNCPSQGNASQTANDHLTTGKVVRVLHGDFLEMNGNIGVSA
jgi:hypothetical protein